MSYPTKFTTCCYCGAPAVLVLRGKVSHELSCGSCGAPIQVMKWLPLEPKPERQPQKERKPTISHKAVPKSFKKPKRKKRRKSSLKWLYEEAKDLVEDIFD